MVAQGLRENWKQFTLLVIINGFVGGMVGMERSILPELATETFNVAAKTALLSFIVVFGVSKAITNYYTGAFSDRFGRRNLLILGWLVALPVPWILMLADTWNWVVAANLLLGINQGLTWSSTVVMKIDLVGKSNRGLAMGINESVGYVAVGVAAFVTGWIASRYGIRPYPFYLGIGFSVLGLLFSIFLVRDTRYFTAFEKPAGSLPVLSNIFRETTWRHPQLGSITQAGLINNLNDGMIWGLLPVLLAARGFDLLEIGKIVAIYPLIWGFGQLFTGKLADVFDHKRLLFYGMLLQGLVICGFFVVHSFTFFAVLCVLLGLGTAVVYPTFLAAIADQTVPGQRAAVIGIFRFWRDLGYAIGALLTGIVADMLGIPFAMLLVGIITIISAVIIKARMLATVKQK